MFLSTIKSVSLFFLSPEYCKKKTNGFQNPIIICIRLFKLILKALYFGLKPLNIKNQFLRVAHPDR